MTVDDFINTKPKVVLELCTFRLGRECKTNKIAEWQLGSAVTPNPYSAIGNYACLSTVTVPEDPKYRQIYPITVRIYRQMDGNTTMRIQPSISGDVIPLFALISPGEFTGTYVIPRGCSSYNVRDASNDPIITFHGRMLNSRDLLLTYTSKDYYTCTQPHFTNYSAACTCVPPFVPGGCMP